MRTVADMGDAAEGTTAAVALMGGMAGRGAMEILPFIKANQELVEVYIQEAAAFGLVMTNEQVQRFRDFEKAGIATKKAMLGLSIDVSSRLIPAGEMLHKVFQALIQAWISIPGFIRTIIIAATAMAGVYFTVAGAATLLQAAILRLQAALTTLNTTMSLAQLGLSKMLGWIGVVITGVTLLVGWLSSLDRKTGDLRSELDATTQSIGELEASIATLKGEMEAAAAEAEAWEEKQRDLRLEMANRFGAALMSAIRKRYEEQRSVELEGQEAIFEQEKRMLEARLDAARDAHREGLEDIDDAINDELTRLRRANDDKEREYQRETDALIKAKRDQIDALDDALEEEDAARQKADRERRRALLLEELQNTTYRPRVAEIQEELARLDYEDRRADAEKEIEAKRNELENEIDLIRQNAEDARTERQRNFEDSLRDYQDYLEDLADGRDAHYEGTLTAEQEAFAQQIVAQRAAIDQQLAQAQTAYDQNMADLIAQNAQEIAEINAKYDQLTSDYNIFNEAMQLMLLGNMEEILALLNQYEPNWRTQGKEFVDMMIAGMQDAFPTLADIAKNIALVEQVAKEQADLLDKEARDAAASLKKYSEALAEFKRLTKQLEAEKDKQDRLRRDNEAGIPPTPPIEPYQPGTGGEVARAIGGWTPADQLEFHHAGELTLPAAVASFFKRVGVPTGGGGGNTYQFTIQAHLADRYDFDQMIEDAEYVAQSRTASRVGVRRA
jgi:outer membrane murein-binding lipoprotein Lpp